MRTRLDIERFPSRTSADRNRQASFPAFLGGNSAGETSLLRCLWMLKRTADELPERLPREGQAAHRLKDLGLIARVATRPITAHSTLSQTVVRHSSESPAALIADAGFGVSQVLPVISLCSSAPVGATLILEQPEIHRHPGVRSDLADGLVDAVKTRCIPIVLESGLQPHDVTLCFCTTDEQGTSQIQPLEIEPYAAVANRTKDFFGDEMTDLLAMTQTAMKRQCEEGVGPCAWRIADDGEASWMFALPVCPGRDVYRAEMKGVIVPRGCSRPV